MRTNQQLDEIETLLKRRSEIKLELSNVIVILGLNNIVAIIKPTTPQYGDKQIEFKSIKSQIIKKVLEHEKHELQVELLELEAKLELILDPNLSDNC